ncbi:unnamed protein product [Periconia digitata]|uniref:Uncharacterized protein n=1 Tax=Periconia digitata TaxID=1303443 RepID=A0A9W4XNY3_9PLEO|nr:unnamed protein product [Periconia digitata]
MSPRYPCRRAVCYELPHHFFEASPNSSYPSMSISQRYLETHDMIAQRHWVPFRAHVTDSPSTFCGHLHLVDLK